MAGCASSERTRALSEARRIIADYEAAVRPLETAANLASWEAQASGKDEAYKASEAAANRLDAALADATMFARIKRIRAALHGGETSSPAGSSGHAGQARLSDDDLLVRQIDVLYLRYLGKQVDRELLERMNARASSLEKAFNTYRARVDGRELPDSEVLKVLKTSRDSAYRRKVWEASKGVGAVVAPGLKELVALRNESARRLGFHDYYEMQLELGEMKKEQILKLWDELYELMREPFAAAKAQIDAKLAEDFGISPAELRPWHYQDLFFQEAPAVFEFDFDPIYAHADVNRLSAAFYAGIGLPIDDVLARSDLFERPGKYPHAQCAHIDREGDIRVMANVVPNEQWMGTMLHELGHAVYDKYIPRSLPYTLRTPAHTFTTEGLAMMFERFSRQPAAIQAMGLAVSDPDLVGRAEARSRRARTLIFAAWSQTIVRFEMAMYEHPDQDLNRLWWDLAEKYQLLRRPDGRNAPDYASKIHVISAPAYYHSYLMGEMFAHQLFGKIARDVLKTGDPTPVFNGRKEIGEFLKTAVFAPGAALPWDEMVRRATGEELSPRAMMEAIGGQ
ncbi:MAG: M2 family metallopeptidase [Phycisphaerae bacterium]